MGNFWGSDLFSIGENQLFSGVKILYCSKTEDIRVFHQQCKEALGHILFSVWPCDTGITENKTLPKISRFTVTLSVKSAKFPEIWQTFPDPPTTQFTMSGHYRKHKRGKEAKRKRQLSKNLKMMLQLAKQVASFQNCGHMSTKTHEFADGAYSAPCIYTSWCHCSNHLLVAMEDSDERLAVEVPHQRSMVSHEDDKNSTNGC